MGGLAVARVIKFQRPAPTSSQDPWESFDWNAAGFWHTQLPECMSHARVNGFTPDDMIAILFRRSAEGAGRIPYVVFEREPGFQKIYGPEGQVARA